MEREATVMEPPLKGEWAIFNPPGHPALAFDLLAVNKKKSPYRKGGLLRHMLTFIGVEDTHAWAKPVFSPVDGTVVASVGGKPDRLRINMPCDIISLMLNRPNPSDGFGAFGGNTVIIEFDGKYVLLAHMRCGSVAVKTGDHVRAGEKIGEVGNSGSSVQPHLHLQLMSSADPFPLFQNLLPFRFSRGKRISGGNWREETIMALSNGDHLLFDA